MLPPPNGRKFKGLFVRDGTSETSLPLNKAMKHLGIMILAAVSLQAADQQAVDLALQAQAAYNAVELAPAPPLRDTIACVQAHAAALAVAAKPEIPVLHFRKGYCALAGASLRNSDAEFAAAAAELEKAIGTWHYRSEAKNAAPQPVPAGLRSLAAVARLNADTSAGALKAAEDEISKALESRVCPGNAMPSNFCEASLEAGRQWLGWIALRREDPDRAVRILAPAPSSAWSYWASGRQAFRNRDYRSAASNYAKAVEAWTEAERIAKPGLADRIKPEPDLAGALTDLGGARLLAGNPQAALASLDAAIRKDPSLARAFYLRGRARELVGQREAAAADYNMASRTAFASAADLASGEAHLYRGVMQFSLGEYDRAEEEFANALNFEITPALKADAEAWRHMAAVAGGSCVDSRERLERSLETVTPYFPKQEARTLAAACMASTSVVTPGNKRDEPGIPRQD